MHRFIARSLALATPLVLALSLTSAPASADEVSAQAAFSFGCGEGNSNRANFSWERGTINTRIYHNNHCRTAQPVRVYLRDAAGSWSVCWTVPTGKGSREFHHGLTGQVDGMRKGC